jgi:hypothetical protein
VLPIRDRFTRRVSGRAAKTFVLALIEALREHSEACPRHLLQLLDREAAGR